MSAVHSKGLEVFNAAQFKESVSEPEGANVYFTIGKVRPWANESNPDIANTSALAYYEVWKNMIGGKRVTGNDIQHCVPRIDWQSGVIYTPYNDIIDSKSFNTAANGFYVMNDDFEVFKCLGNNNGNESTIKPTTFSETTADGYVWKYMYTIPAAYRLRFLTDDFMPVVQSAAVRSNAVPGELAFIDIVDSGSDYTDNNLSIIITGDGTGANAFPIRNVFSNTIESIVVDIKGKDYTFATATIIAEGDEPSTTAILNPIISPPGGHGSDTLTELGASYLMINMRLRGSEGGKLITTNDYRQVSLIESPYNYATNRISSNTVFKQVMGLTLSGVSVDYQLDELVYQGENVSNATFSGVVTSWDSTNNYIELNNTIGIPISDSLVGNTSTARRFVNSVTFPDFEPFTGRLLYKDNISPIERAEDQTDSFQIILKF